MCQSRVVLALHTRTSPHAHGINNTLMFRLYRGPRQSCIAMQQKDVQHNAGRHRACQRVGLRCTLPDDHDNWCP